MRHQHAGHGSAISEFGLAGTRPGWRAALVRAGLATAAIIGLLGGNGRAFSQCEPQWSPGFHLRGTDGGVSAITSFDDGSGRGLELYIGGGFTMAGEAWANNVAKWDGASWRALAAGTNGSVTALAVFDDGQGPALYAAGSFNEAGGMPANNIAKWDGEAWSPVSGGVNGTVAALVVHDDGTRPSLYVGGTFTQADGVAASNLARWDGIEWSSVGGGPSGEIEALLSFDDGSGSTLYAAGRFSMIGGVAAKNIARWNGNAWTSLGEGLDGPGGGHAEALIGFDDGTGSALYASGSFTTAGGQPAVNIARWDGSGWHPLGDGIPDDSVRSLAVFDGGSGPRLHASGSQLVSWDGNQWSVQGSPSGPVAAMHACDIDGTARLFVGGGFRAVDDTVAFRIASWNGSTWAPLAHGNGVSFPLLYTLEALEDEQGTAIYAGGYAADYWGGAISENIARWDGHEWTAIPGTSEHVWAFASFSPDPLGPKSVYAGGDFDYIGGIAASKIARWDGTTWHALAQGVTIQTNIAHGPGSVQALEVFDDGGGPALYVAGSFTHAGGLLSPHIAKWDGYQWHAVPGLTFDYSGNIVDLQVFDDGSTTALYACGRIRIGEQASTIIARWNGREWDNLSPGSHGSAWALTVFDDGFGECLYLAGALTSIGGIDAVGLAKWNGRSWSGFDQLHSGTIRDLACIHSGEPEIARLFIGGHFTFAAGAPEERVAAWDGESFLPIGPFGFVQTPQVRTLAVLRESHSRESALYIGGTFFTAGDHMSLGIARWGCIEVPCLGDIAPDAGDGQIDSDDLLAVIDAWGSCADPQDCAADLDANGTVNVLDLLALINAWGPCP